MKSITVLVLLMALSHFPTNENVEVSIEYDRTDGPWTKLLQEYALRNLQKKPRAMQSTDYYIPKLGFLITKRVGEGLELQQRKHPAGKVISPSNVPLQQSYSVGQQLREVSETDLYLLGAIEKLVYRVDYLEHRIRRTEQLLYNLMAGTKQKEAKASCPNNFTRVAENCYFFSETQQLNWKSANNVCKSLESHLAEFENLSEFENIVSYLKTNKKFERMDLWLGGLNPGLLWIWSNSAKPVNPNTNYTSVASALNQKLEPKLRENDEKILNNAEEIRGVGRCLKFSYDAKKQTYKYFGEECTSPKLFLCEYLDRTNENNMEEFSRSVLL